MVLSESVRRIRGGASGATSPFAACSTNVSFFTASRTFCTTCTVDCGVGAANGLAEDAKVAPRGASDRAGGDSADEEAAAKEDVLSWTLGGDAKACEGAAEAAA